MASLSASERIAFEEDFARHTMLDASDSGSRTSSSSATVGGYGNIPETGFDGTTHWLAALTMQTPDSLAVLGTYLDEHSTLEGMSDNELVYNYITTASNMRLTFGLPVLRQLREIGNVTASMLYSAGLDEIGRRSAFKDANLVHEAKDFGREYIRIGSYVAPVLGIADAGIDLYNGDIDIGEAILAVTPFGRIHGGLGATQAAERGVVAPLTRAEVRAKIFGTAQQTGSDGAHAFRSYREAILLARNPEVEAVFLNRGYNRGLDLAPKTISPNRRPDVLGRYFDGRVDRVEVWSRTDDPLVLSSRNSALDRQIIQQGYTPLTPRVVYPVRGQ